jgi:hypothetical protein
VRAWPPTARTRASKTSLPSYLLQGIGLTPPMVRAPPGLSQAEADCPPLVFRLTDRPTHDSCCARGGATGRLFTRISVRISWRI